MIQCNDNLLKNRLFEPVKWLLFGILLSILAGIMFSHASAEPIPFNASIPGERNQGQEFTFTMNNVSGTYASSDYRFTVYDYRILGNNYSYYSVNWAAWFKELADPGKKYMAVWIRGTMEGTSYFGWGQEQFNVWVNGRGFYSEPVKLQDIPIRGQFVASRDMVIPAVTNCASGEIIEPEQVIIGSGGSKNPVGSSNRYLPVIIQEIENLKATNERGQLTTERYGWKDEHELDRMVPGETVEGFVLFQIPDATLPEEVQVAGYFRNYGTAVWNLVEREIDQDSVEKMQFIERNLMGREILAGDRTTGNEDETRQREIETGERTGG